MYVCFSLNELCYCMCVYVLLSIVVCGLYCMLYVCLTVRCIMYHDTCMYVYVLLQYVDMICDLTTSIRPRMEQIAIRASHPLVTLGLVSSFARVDSAVCDNSRARLAHFVDLLLHSAYAR